MALSRTVSALRSRGTGEDAAAATGWFPVARSADVTTRPVPVGAGGRAYVVVRLRPGGEVTALSARCPHRLVPLAAASVVDGTLQCPYHGWRFNAEGRCVDIPSLGAEGTPPPRADLSAPWAVEERHGWVWLAPERTTVQLPPKPASTPLVEPVPPAPAPEGPVFHNLHRSLDHAWHPVALSSELVEGGWLAVRLLGRSWTVHRGPEGLTTDPPAWSVEERLGVIWLAPAEPHGHRLEVPEDGDPRFTAGWLPPARTAAPAGLLADNFLDVAHFPFVHAATFGAADEREVPAYDVTPEPGGFTSVQEQWFDNPADPGVLDGTRPLRQRRRATYVVRAPFQLLLRLEELDAGAVKTILFLLQPEDADSTRVYTCMLLHGIGGADVVEPDVLAAELAFEETVLAEDLALQQKMDSIGLPLTLRDELHVRADRLGVALRRTLGDFAAGRG
ncbi:Rieske 2Fe-2S domain-containing protein [Modestobacter sp. I12A-02628]|uniref:Rieske 2Fe-2S domain-containing protein n=1 Tax=Goekera deserti TaxID=2497753 RepID=A0A7K3WI47_9ACTN|nr:Rieske 2Fe-2S domain-containing protein [Goekera deserti]MPQ97776.1 Rieske 2Fe-2S domain-containing protein [Goekera deserti]NDI48421.1 Rieske 2Fe-2S domain-containing protein [Goekera deserti]NEL56022.1 Rieske 2Fe-2S domain-containing protein [Goekera deserti]